MKMLVAAAILLASATVALDEFGQNKNASFCDKVSSAADLVRFDEAEERELRRASIAKHVYPKHKYFGIKKLQNRWWFIDPTGKPFYSTGIDCISASSTDKNKRSFYSENLIRKWGQAKYLDKAQQRAFARMRAWHFNTLGNWCDELFIAKHELPYVHMGPKIWQIAIPFIEGDICDVFNPSFVREAERVAAELRANADDELLVGYFVDNELPWWNIGYDVLAADDKLHAKQEWLRRLKAKYGTIAKLNSAWKTEAQSWEMLRWPGDKHSPQADSDVAEFRGDFADRFYAGWYAAIKKADPNHLVLGSRIPYPMDEVVAACARHTDVLSFNHYSTSVGQDLPRYYRKLGKPILIGEYGFDSLDEGLVAAHVKVKSQQDRGFGYSYLTEAFAAKPYIVGSHYFQYIDEPITGRGSDGENSFNGFVRVTDIPYPALVRSAKFSNARVAGIHAGRIKPTSRRPAQ